MDNQKDPKDTDIVPQSRSSVPSPAPSPDPQLKGSEPQPLPAPTPLPPDHPIETTPEQHFQPQNNRKVPFIVIALILFILVIAGTVIWFATKTKEVKSTPPTTSQSVQPATLPDSNASSSTYNDRNSIQMTRNNTNRQNDAAVINAHVAAFYANNDGVLPETTKVVKNQLYICGTSCGGTTDVRVPYLAYYSPAKVSIHPYAPELEVPDPETVYIVNGATCASRSQISPTRGSSIDSVVLFALEEPTSKQQMCIQQ